MAQIQPPVAPWLGMMVDMHDDIPGYQRAVHTKITVPRAVWVLLGLALLLCLSATGLPLTAPEHAAFGALTADDAYEDIRAGLGLAAAGAVVVAAALVAVEVYRGAAVFSAALLFAVVVVVVMLLQSSPMTCWDGQDSQGRPVGGCYKYVPSWGLVALGLAGLAATTASLWVLLKRGRLHRKKVLARSNR